MEAVDEKSRNQSLQGTRLYYEPVSMTHSLNGEIVSARLAAGCGTQWWTHRACGLSGDLWQVHAGIRRKRAPDEFKLRPDELMDGR